MSRRVVAGPLRPAVHVSGFVRKEIKAVLRQPRLLGVLVVGPFLLLSLFAIGYDQEQTVLETVFVGPDNSVYESSVDEFADQLPEYLRSEGYTTDLAGARRRLADGEIDLVVVFPADPAETVLAGEQVVIQVLHDKLDPIQQTAVEVTSQVAVQELNDLVMEEIVTDLQAELDQVPEGTIDQAVETVSERDGAAGPDGMTQLVLDQQENITSVDPAVVVRPFTADTTSLLREPVAINDFFAPAAIALLVQHMALTFASLTIVRDRHLGLFELYRVGPIEPGRVLLGTYLAHLVLGTGVAAVLLVGARLGIGVPFRGDPAWAAIGIAGLVTASVAGGMVLSLLARSDTQAVQFAMLALLAGLFFGGFLLDLDALRYPVKAISLALPVTYGTRLLRDVMLRGAEPAVWDLLGLVATSLAFAGLAWWLMARQLRLGRVE